MIVTCGIDFGTSNTASAYAKNNRVDVAALEGRHKSIPSAMFFVAPKNMPMYGRAAINAFIDNVEGRFMRSVKRLLGTDLMNKGTRIGREQKKFTQILGGFLRDVKDNTEESSKTSIDHVVMGRPVFFVDGDPSANELAQKQLSDIAKMIGFKHVEFQFEPIAAAFAHEERVTEEHLALVADIGGGTSDFTIVRLSPERANKLDRQDDILANTGVRVGGNDFDKALSINSFMPELGYGTTYGHKNLRAPLIHYHDLSEWSKVNGVYTFKNIRHFKGFAVEAKGENKQKLSRMVDVLEAESGHAILGQVEATKIELTQKKSFMADLNFVEEGLNVKVDRETFDNAITPSQRKIRDAATECLKQAGLSTKDITMVILTGGSTEVPLIQNTFSTLCPRAVISGDDKFGSVARGLAFDSIRRFNI